MSFISQHYRASYGIYMKSFIKLEGAAVSDGIKALEKMALKMPEVCIMDTFIESEPDTFNTQTGIMNYFAVDFMGFDKRCSTLVSKSAKTEGYDFVFEWFVKPNAEQLKNLEMKIGETLKPLKLKYTIKSK